MSKRGFLTSPIVVPHNEKFSNFFFFLSEKQDKQDKDLEPKYNSQCAIIEVEGGYFHSLN